MCTAPAVCGQLVDMNTGLALRAADPLGRACTDSDTELPCTVSVKSTDFARTTTTPGVVDDCGRFAVPVSFGADATIFVDIDDRSGAYRAASHAITATSPTTDVKLGSLLATTTASWLAGAFNPVDAILIEFRTDAGTLRAGAAATIAGGPLSAPPTLPYAYYFDATGSYNAIDAAATNSSAVGTALVMPANDAADQYSGGGTGFTCLPVSIRRLAERLLFVRLSSC